MSVESLQHISGGFYIAAGIFFAISVMLLFLFRIWQVLGDLTGRTARKGIERIRKENAFGEGVRYKRRGGRPVRRMERQEIGNTEKFMTEELLKMHENVPTQAAEEVSVELVAELGFCESTEIIE